MKAIVTGANGFVGSATVRKLVSMGMNVLAIDIPNCSSNLDLLNSQIEYMPLFVEDIANLKTKVHFGDYDLFYHFAWKGSAGNLRFDEQVQMDNALLTVKCLRIAGEIGCKKFVCAGTIMEYEVSSVIYAQGTEPELGYIYGVGKQTAHSLCKPIANSIGIDLVWAYITNAYGVGERSPRLLNTTLKKIIDGEKLEFTSAMQNYDFVYVDDVANAFYLLGVKGIANRGYLIGSGQAKPLKEFILDIIKAVNTKLVPSFGDVPFTGVSLPLEVFDISEMKKIGFIPEVTFKDGVKKTYRWWKEGPE